MAGPILDPETFALWQLVMDRAGRGPVDVLVLGARQAPRGDLDRIHCHHIPTVVLALSGVVRIRTANSAIDLDAGGMLVVAPGAWHRHEPLRRGCAAFLQGITAGGSDIECGNAEGRGLRSLLPLLPSAELLGRLAAEPDGAVRRVLARDLLQLSLAGGRTLAAQDAAVARMAHFLWMNIHRPVDAAQVLAASGLGARQAHRRFTAAFGQTPKQVLLAGHLALAAQHLREGAGVAEAAAESGFRGRADLTRAWRRVHGRPPTAGAAD